MPSPAPLQIHIEPLLASNLCVSEVSPPALELAKTLRRQLPRSAFEPFMAGAAAESSREPSEERLAPIYLHKLVWVDDAVELEGILCKGRATDASGYVLKPHSQVDSYFRGMTPLLLAVQLNHPRCIDVLIRAGADTMSRTELGFSVLQEATSLGNRELIKTIYRRRTHQLRALVKKSAALLRKVMTEDIPDFYIEIRWKVKTWFPFVEKYCPHDFCRLWKRGTEIRLDTTVVGMEKEKIKVRRSNFSLLSRFDEDGLPVLIAIDHDQRLWFQPDSEPVHGEELEEFINVQLNMEIFANTLENKKGLQINAVPDKSGIFTRSQRTKIVEGVETDVYVAKRVTVYTRARTEHLTSSDRGITTKLFTDARLNKFGKTKMSDTPDIITASSNDQSAPRVKGSLSRSISLAKQRVKEFAPSRSPPPPTSITLDEYFLSCLEDPSVATYLHAGRALDMIVKKKTVNAFFYMAQQYPLKLSHLVPILRAFAPGSERMEKLIDFMELQLPPGFPVKIEIPLLFFLSASIKFKNYMHVDLGISQFYEQAPGGGDCPRQVPIDHHPTRSLLYVPESRGDWFSVPKSYEHRDFLTNIFYE